MFLNTIQHTSFQPLSLNKQYAITSASNILRVIGYGSANFKLSVYLSPSLKGYELKLFECLC